MEEEVEEVFEEELEERVLATAKWSPAPRMRVVGATSRLVQLCDSIPQRLQILRDVSSFAEQQTRSGPSQNGDFK